ncbi:MAG: DUF6263 family protein [Fimbriiglobus sp.]|nr:DUF6263 family protein [Fimbriiglobus sp.]
MTALRNVLTVAAVLAAVGFGFAQDKKADEPKPPTPPAPAPASDKQKFEPKFELNKPFFQLVTTDVDQTVKVQGGNDLKLKHSQTFFFKWLPTKQDGDKWTVQLTIEGVKLRVDVASNPVSYDSTTENANTQNPGLNEFFKNLVGSTFTVVFGKGMQPEKVEGQEALLKNLGAANQQMEALLKKILTTESLKEMSDPLAGLTPGTEKGPNEKWTKTTKLTLGPIGEYDRQYTFEYKGKDKEKAELDRVEVKANLTYKPPQGDADGLLFRIKSGDLATQNPKAGYYLFDPKTGWLVKSELAVTMSGTLVVAVGQTETSVQLFQTQTTTVETKGETFLPKKQ